ncbi:hypothetical protein JJL56_26500 [Azospirillum sp. YIM DDC1]|uniref:Uncharacterized protein n=1 Tax=Azospirillum aestuarii TaxID=2802052 RepID=A0ABS1I5Q4_9PROT|nr:hypothetical protein [Azospirillum aestuarii]MBK4722409.1 hypothetical protein [Azospirillum aestuarii]
MDPVTAIMIANTALNIGRLFMSGGGSLQAMEVELLKKLSEQIVAVQKGIMEILQRLEDLEATLGQVPRDVVFELYKAKVRGISGRLIELKQTYDADLRAHDIKYAAEQNREELEEEILAPLREARDVLMSYPQFALLPVVSECAFHETFAMSMLTERKTRADAAIDRYRNWVTVVTEGDANDDRYLHGALQNATNEMASLIQKAKEKAKFECYEKVWTVDGPVPGCPPGVPVSRFWSLRSDDVWIEVDPSAFSELNAVAAAMIAEGTLSSDEAPVKAQIRVPPGPDGPWKHIVQSCLAKFVRIVPQDGSPSIGDYRPEEWASALLPCQAEFLNARTRMTETADKLTKIGPRVVSLRALSKTSKDTLTFLNDFQAKIAKLEHGD